VKRSGKTYIQEKEISDNHRIEFNERDESSRGERNNPPIGHIPVITFLRFSKIGPYPQWLSAYKKKNLLHI